VHPCCSPAAQRHEFNQVVRNVGFSLGSAIGGPSFNRAMTFGDEYSPNWGARPARSTRVVAGRSPGIAECGVMGVEGVHVLAYRLDLPAANREHTDAVVLISAPIAGTRSAGPLQNHAIGVRGQSGDLQL
jgi:hypothetical protein